MFRNDGKFVKEFYLQFGGTGDGQTEQAPLPFVSGDLWSIPAGCVIEKCYFIIDTAITGTTALTVGDDDSANGFILDQASNLATPGMYSWDAKTCGAYLRIQTAGATDAGDVYVVPTAKYYAAAGKELKLVNTTANTAGKARVVVEGVLHKY
jgi:hypothetical protein